MLGGYDWPGNVRELERVIERAVALACSEFLEPDDLPPALLGGYRASVAGESGFVSDTRAMTAAANKVIGMTGISPPHASAPGNWDV